MAKKNKYKIKHEGFQKYVMIVTSEDSRYMSGESDSKPLDYWVDNPWDGKLVDIVYGNKFSELIKHGKYEGLFFYLYSTVTGERIGYGTLDLDGSRKELKEYAAYLKRKDFVPDRWHGKKKAYGKYALIVFSAKPHACGKVNTGIDPEQEGEAFSKAPWAGLFEDVLYGDCIDDFRFGFLNGCYVQLFRRDTGECVYTGACQLPIP